MLTDITLGSDAEFFLTDYMGKLVPALKYIEGTKARPAPFGQVKGFATQVDGLCAEVNIPPARLPSEFAKNLMAAKAYVNNVCQKQTYANHQRAMLTTIGAVDVPDELLYRDEVMTMGCDPSFNAYTGEKEPTGDPSMPIRGAGLHVHIGYSKEQHTVATNRYLIQAMDYTLGVSAALRDPFFAKRQQLGYGKAGNYRPQNHGVEYRTLSAWSARSEASLLDVALRTICAIVIVNRNEALPSAELIQDAINGNNRSALERLEDQFLSRFATKLAVVK